MAWRHFSGRLTLPQRIDVLRQGAGSGTYRLVGVGPSGRSIVAQRKTVRETTAERVVYEQVLPQTPVTAPRFYGCKADDPDFAWTFVEDLGDRHYGEVDPVHRSLAGRWFGLLHSAASQIAAARRLPDVGPERHRGQLRTARAHLLAAADNPSLESGDAGLLQGTVAELDDLEREWSLVEHVCEGVPPTLVHGDFRTRHACVRRGRDGLALFPIDWGTAGWGVPAADLTRLDLPAYTSVIHSCWWPDACLERIEQLAVAGRIFSSLAAIASITGRLADEQRGWLAAPLARVRMYRQQLAGSIRHLGDIV